MHKNVTAIYRTHEIADKVRCKIGQLGLSNRQVHLVPDTTDIVAGNTTRDENLYRDDLDHMGLPDNERHTYDSALKRGDYVVSVRVDRDDEHHLDRITEIMRHPEAHDIDALDETFRDTAGNASRTDAATRVGRRDTDYDYRGSTVRGYDYDHPYEPRTERV